MSVVEPTWITADEVIEINRVAVALGHVVVRGLSENHFLKDERAIESAIDRAQNHFHYRADPDDVDIILYATALCIGISQAQAFENGNKRTALGAMERFLNRNDMHLAPDAADVISEMILMTAHEDRRLRWDEERFAEAVDHLVLNGPPASGSSMQSLMSSVGARLQRIYDEAESSDIAVRSDLTSEGDRERGELFRRLYEETKRME